MPVATAKSLYNFVNLISGHKSSVHTELNGCHDTYENEDDQDIEQAETEQFWWLTIHGPLKPLAQSLVRDYIRLTFPSAGTIHERDDDVFYFSLNGGGLAL